MVNEKSTAFFWLHRSHADVLFQRSEVCDLDWEILQVFLAHTYNFLIEDINDERNTGAFVLLAFFALFFPVLFVVSFVLSHI